MTLRARTIPETETGFQGWVIAYAKAHGWRVAHFHKARRKDGGWSTPVAADGAGFPDLVLVRNRVIWAELKTDVGRLSPEQDAWMTALIIAGECHYVWRPKDRAEIEEVLR